MDADINTKVLWFNRELRPCAHTRLLDNVYKRFERALVELDDFDAMLNQMGKSVDAGKNIFAVTNVKDYGKKSYSCADCIYDYFTKVKGLAPDQVLYIRVKPDEELPPDLFENVDDDWKVRVLIITPTVTAGVSFDERWFHESYILRRRVHQIH